MEVAIVGVGEMGVLMAGHIAAKGYRIHANDVVPANIEAAVARGAKPAATIADLPSGTDVYLVMVRTDSQVAQVVDDILKGAKAGAIIAVSGTHHPSTMKALGAKARERGVGV